MFYSRFYVFIMCNAPCCINLSMSFSFCYRMESTEKCEVVIQHFNGKYLKTPPGIPGKKTSLSA